MGALLLMSSCAQPPPGGGGDDRCSVRSSEDFEIGMVQFEDPRWFRAFEEGCDSIEVQEGIQGGWHVEPGIQAAAGSVREDLGGQLQWRVLSEAGAPISMDKDIEMFRNFWQELEGGFAYWGDFVVFDGYPADHVGTVVTLEAVLTFDEESALEPLTIRRDVTLLDEERIR